MAEYSRVAKGNFTAASTQTAAVINLPFQPDFVEVWNYTNIAAGVTDSTITRAWWDNKLVDASTGDNSTMIEGYNSSGALVYDVVQTNGISSFYAGQLLQYGPTVLLGTTGGAGIAKTSSTVLTVTTASAHGLVPGNWVIFQNLYQTSTTGMQQLAGIPFQVLTSASTTTFTIGWVGNAANLTAITTAATGAASFKQILYPALYEPGIAFPWSISVSGGVGTVKTTAPHNFQVGQEIAFRIPTIYGGTQLNSLPDVNIPGSPQYYYVASVLSATSFTFNNAPTITTFSVANPTFSSFPGLKFPQVVAVGDVNSGGFPYAGAALYPSPTVYNGSALTAVSSINGPAIQGAYINNTSQGFIIGPGAPTVITGTTIVTASSQIYWRAYLSDFASP
jgi:hypothetical protein